MESTTIEAPRRIVQVDQTTKKKPKIVAQLNDWQYIERSLHRLIAGWGRHFSEWTDMNAIPRHIWEQSECVRRLRERLVQFPGTVTNLDAPVSAQLEALVNTVLLAPSREDAVDGIYQILTNALVQSYIGYVETAHPVHDAPTVAMLREIMQVKEQQRLWLREYRRRNAHTTDAAYKAAIERELERCGNLLLPLEVTEPAAQPLGVATAFRLPAHAPRPAGSEQKYDIGPYLEIDFADKIETRRLFWCYGYMLEMNLAQNQLRWIYDAYYMPWEFLQDVSRHLWDESRHGDSGYSRLLDFGITIQEIGYSLGAISTETTEPMTKQEIYEAIFFIGMVAETGHFHVKHEAYADFKEGGDLESAEMMLFDIIDETTHVQYAHRWIPLLAEEAGIDASDYKEQGHQMRQQRQEGINKRIERYKETLDCNAETNPDYAFYQSLVARIREKVPLSNADTCPPRSLKPM